MITKWKEWFLSLFKKPNTPKEHLKIGVFWVVTNAISLIFWNNWLSIGIAFVFIPLGVLHIIEGINKSSRGGKMKQLISRAASAIGVQFERFVVWFNDPTKHVMQGVAKVLGVMLGGYGLFIVYYATSLARSIPQMGFIISGTAIFFLGIALIVTKINGYAGGVK